MIWRLTSWWRNRKAKSLRMQSGLYSDRAAREFKRWMDRSQRAWDRAEGISRKEEARIRAHYSDKPDQ